MQKQNNSKYRFTIVIPLYNQRENIALLSKVLTHYLHHSLFETCILFVDDGSDDGGFPLLKAACAQEERFCYIRLVGNSGLSTALKAGFDAVETEYVGYMDADMQTTPDDFDSLLPYIDKYTMVTGIRSHRCDSFFKRLQSHLANSIRRHFTHDGIVDTGCPLKVLRTDYAKRIPFFNGMHRFLPALVMMDGGNVKQVPVRHFPRTAGKSKYHLWNRLVSPFIDCFAISWMQKRHIQYEISETDMQ